MALSSVPVPSTTDDLNGAARRLHEESWKRIAMHNAEGRVLSGVDEHYVAALVEELLGPDVVARVRYWHEVWLKEQIDEMDSNLRRAAIMDPRIPRTDEMPMMVNGERVR